MSTTFRGLVIEDPVGEAFQATIDAAWRRAERKAAGRSGGRGEPARYYQPPALPTWTAPPFVTRQLLGRFVLDTDTGLLHDVQHATEACGIDGLANTTWIHFAHELERAIYGTAERFAANGARAPGVVPCGRCMPAPAARA